MSDVSAELVVDEGWREAARHIAREEIASLSGMILRRLQDMGPTRSNERNMAVKILAELFGEALADFSASDAPGPPGK